MVHFKICTLYIILISGIIYVILPVKTKTKILLQAKVITLNDVVNKQYKFRKLVCIDIIEENKIKHKILSVSNR